MLEEPKPTGYIRWVPRQLYWGELKGGLIATAVIAAITLAILLFARVGGLHGDKVTLYIVLDEAPDILAGSEVWLAGEKEGLVKEVSFRPPTVDTSERLLIKTEFLKDALPGVRRDSYAQIRPGGGLIGTPIIYVSAGTVGSPPLHDGDTIQAHPKTAMRSLTTDIATVAPEFAALGAATRNLNDKITHSVGTLGNLRASGLSDLEDVRAGVASLNARANGNGTLGLLARGNLRQRAAHAMAAADSIRTLVSSNKGSIGRFRRDSTLATKTRHVAAELDTLRALLTSPVGTIAAVHSDSALARELDREHQLLAELMKDIKSHPLRYIRF